MKSNGNETTLENELLLLCARSELDKKSSERVKVLLHSQGFDGENLFQLASQNRVMPLLYTNIDKVCEDGIPDKVRSHLHSSFSHNAARNKFLAGNLLVIIQLLNLHHIKAVPFKGPALAVSAYGDLNLRTFCDLDILIAEKDVESAVRLLLRHGYSSFLDQPLDQYLYLVQQGHHAYLQNKETHVVVELHWEMTGRYFGYSLDLEEIIPALEDITLLDHEVSNIGPEFLLVYLCIHGNRHLWLQLDFVCGVAELLKKRAEIDWSNAIGLADKIGARRMLLLGLMLANKLLDAPVPDHVQHKIKKDPRLKDLESKAEGFLFSSIYTIEKIGYLKALVFHYQTMDRFVDGLRYSLRKIFIPDAFDMKWIPLPRFMWGLYKIVRPLRLSLNSLLEYFPSRQR